MEPDFYLNPRLSTRSAVYKDRNAIGSFLTEMLGEFGLDLDHYGTDRDIVDLPKSFIGGGFWLIEEGDKIVGTFSLFPFATNEAEVRKMYLHPNYRGQGLGRKMLDFVLKFAKEKNIERLELETASTMETARAMYEKAGFIEIDIIGKTVRCDRRYFKNIANE